MKKNSQTKGLLKYIKVRQRKAFLSLFHIILTFVLLITSALLIIGSYFLTYLSGWFSSLLQSLGIGIITGIVVYIMGNIRETTKGNIKREIAQLEKLYSIINKIYYIKPYRNFYSNDEYQMLPEHLYNYSMEYLNLLKKLDYPLKVTLIRETNFDFDNVENNINKILDNLQMNNCNLREAYYEIIRNLQDVNLWLDERLDEDKIKDIQIERYPL